MDRLDVEFPLKTIVLNGNRHVQVVDTLLAVVQGHVHGEANPRVLAVHMFNKLLQGS